MSELIGEARVLVTPDTTKFRSLLIAQVATAAKGVTVPIQVTPTVTGATGTAGTVALLAAQRDLAAASTGTTAALAREQQLLARGGVLLDGVALKEDAVASAVRGADDARKAATRSAAAQARQLGQLERGAGATALTFAGLRGATLAASGAFIAGAAGVLALSKAIGEFASFQEQLNVFQATTSATGDQLHRVGEEARALGSDVTLPAVSASDAATAMTELAKAGLSVQDSIAGARGVLELGTAAQIDFADSTTLVASALNAFGLGGDQAIHVADLLASASNEAQGSISDMGLALSQAAAVGRQVGLSLEDTVGLLTLLARNGLRGSDAGTSLRTTLIRLINPTKAAQTEINKLGLRLRDANGNIRPELFTEFATATANLTAKQRDAAAAVIAGTDGIRALTILGREGAAGLDEVRTALDREGSAADLAAARSKGLAGETRALQSNLETLGLTIGQGVTPFLEGMVKGLDIATTGLNKGLGGIVGFLGALGGSEFDSANANLSELLGHLNDLQEQTRTGPGAFDFSTENVAPELQQTADQVAAIGKALLALGPQGVQKFVAAFKQASPLVREAMQDNVITPLEAAQLQTTALGRAFLAGLPKSAFVGLAGAIKSGLEDAGAAAKAGVADTAGEIHSGIEDAGRQAVVDARKLGTDLGDALKTSISDAIKSGASAVGPAVSNLQLSLAQASGNQGQELSVLRAQQARQQKFLDTVLGRESNAKNLALATKAANNLQQTNAAIDRILADQQAARDKIVSDAKQRAAKAQQQAQAAKTAQQQADQAVLDSFTPAQNRLDLTAITANATARLSDNVKLQNAIIAEANREVKIITDTVKNVKTRNAALAAQAKVIRGAEVERDRLLGEIAQTATENRQKAANAVQTFLANQITLAELRENDSAELAAINKAITNAHKRINNYKKLGLNLQEEKIALERLINQRDALLNTAQSATEGVDAGTTLVDLFKSTQEIANQAGNVGRLPSDLTSNAANQPIRDLVQQRLDIQLANPTADSLARSQMTATERLTSSIDQLNSTLTGGVINGLPAGIQRGDRGLAKAVDGAARFRYQRVANSLVEAGVWG